MKIRTILGVGVVAASLLLYSCSTKSSNTRSTQAATTTADNRKPAPDFTLQDASGTKVTLSAMRGKVVLLNFWATWCGPCQLEIPWFVEFEQQYRAAGLEVVGVSMDEEGWKVIKPFVAEHKINYRVLLGTDSVGQLYGGVDSLPTTFIIGRDGNVANVHVGLAGKNEYLEEIQKLLSTKKTDSSRAGLLDMPAVLMSGAAK